MDYRRVKEAAAYVGLSKSSLDKFRFFGSGPAYSKVGRAVIYATADLDNWLASQRRITTWSGSNDNSLRQEGVAA
jgi:predicted DNA-binding transcriptional regulator AlpA